MMTRTGTNDLHGSATWLYWNNRLNSPHLFQRQTYYRNIANANAIGNTAQAASLASQPIMAAGFSKSVNLTLGGPVYIPKLINGKNKLFFFTNYGWNRELRIGANASGINTVPTAAARRGDFSPMLAINSQYQVYDPLIRNAGPGAGRALYPNAICREHHTGQQNHQPDVPLLPEADSGRQRRPARSANQEPLNNYRTAGDPDPITNQIFGTRLDYNLSDKHRFFFRFSQEPFHRRAGRLDVGN